MALPKTKLVLFVPLVRIVNFMGIHGTLWAVILPWFGWPFKSSSWNSSVKTPLQNCSNLLNRWMWWDLYSLECSLIRKPGFAALAIFTFSSIHEWLLYAVNMLTSRNNPDPFISLRGCDYAGWDGDQPGLIMQGLLCSCANRNNIFSLSSKNPSLKDYYGSCQKG